MLLFVLLLLTKQQSVYIVGVLGVNVFYIPYVSYLALAQAVAGSSLSNQTTFPVIVLAFIGITIVGFAKYCPKIMKIFSLF